MITDAWLMLLVADASLPSSVYIHTTVDLRRIRPLFWKKIKPEILVYFPVCSSRLEFFFSGSSFSFHTNITEICPLVNAQNRGGTFV